MDLSIYLPVAGTSVPILLLVAIGLLVGGLSGFFGVGAGFLLAPLLIAIGIPPTVAAGSCANQVVASSASGALAHARSRRFDARMALLLLAGALGGGTAGVHLIRSLASRGHADLAVTLLYALILGILGYRMFRDSLRSLTTGRLRRDAGGGVGTLRRTRLERLIDGLPAVIAFPSAGVRHSILVPLALGAGLGLVTALTGIGGGFLLVPILVRRLGIAMPLAVGTVLVTVCLSCVNVTLQHALVNGTVDVVLALILFLGGLLGTQIGIRAGRRLRPGQLEIVLAVIVLFVTLKLGADLLLPPDTPVVVCRTEATR